MKRHAPPVALVLISLALLGVAIGFWRRPVVPLNVWAGLDWSIVALDLSIALIVLAAFIWPRHD